MACAVAQWNAAGDVLEPAEYGRALSGMLFGGWLGQSFTAARRSTDEADASLRVRLFIAPSAWDLHSLHWEALADPQTGESLLSGERILFSRFLSSDDWRRVKRASQADLRALIMVANPKGLEKYRFGDRRLAPVDMERELEIARSGLGTMSTTVLGAGANEQSRASLSNLTAGLRDGYDVVYLVCHGALIDGEPWLWLEDENGNVSRTRGRQVVSQVREAVRVPRLVVLASCQSVDAHGQPGTDDAGVLSALGPEIAKAGVPAVVAMQGDVSMETVRKFMPIFFNELQRDGQIDRAMAIARGKVRDRADAWTPVLLMRLKSGRLWYAPGFRDESKTFQRWGSMLGAIRDGYCTPILGPGLTEALLGTRREIARRLAKRTDAGLTLHDRDDLPQVTQFLAVDQGSTDYAARELMAQLREELLDRRDIVPPGDRRTASLNDLLLARLAQLQAANPAEPHLALARLPFKLYVTTSPSNLLVESLRAVGKHPRVLTCPWTDKQHDQVLDRDYEPDADNPLVYHAFGRFDDPTSMVVTEDDYFDYLIAVTDPRRDLSPAVKRMVKVVNRALASTMLLFLGFQTDDWNFRVLFRSIMNLEGGGLRQRFLHVAVQVEPEEDGLARPERARQYLESYFEGARISVFWGGVDDFMKELVQRQGALEVDRGVRV